MGFVVLHINKASGNDAAMTAHIERRIEPKNADKERTYLNERLVEYPDGVENRTQAIQHRLDTAGITRKIGINQVRALRIMLSGTPEDMQRIEASGQLGQWCRDSIEWLQETFGKENVISADLHRDEKTPHIHATVVPIVTGERRKAAVTPTSGKKKYRKKPANTVRLCADDVMTRDKLKGYQDSYALAMAKYGLQRGIDGSEARHIATPQYYRNLYAKNEDLKEDIVCLEERKQEVTDKIRDLYDRKDEAREKFLNMHEYNKQQADEIATAESRLAQLKQDYEPYRAQEDLNLLLSVFPKMGEYLRIAQLCKGIGLAIETIRRLFNGESITVSGTLHSPEHNRDFDIQNAHLQIFKQHDKPDKLFLSINGRNILEWFKVQFEKLRQNTRQSMPAQRKTEKGVKM